MLEEAGYSARDLLHAADDAGVRMAIFNGIVNETRHQVGDAAKLSDELGGALSKMGESTRKVHRAIGAAIEGPLRQLLNTIQPILERAAKWIERNKELVGTILTVATAVAALTTSGAAWLLLIPKLSAALSLFTSGPVGLAIIGLTALVTAFVAVKNAMKKAREENSKMAESYQKQTDKVDALIEEYQDLSEKTNKTADEKQRMVDLSNQIVEILPNAAKGYDEEGNAILDVNTALREMVLLKGKELEIRAEELEQRVKEAEKEKKLAEKNRDVLKLNKETVERLRKGFGEKLNPETVAKQEEAYQKAWRELTAEIEAAENSAENYKGQLKDIQDLLAGITPEWMRKERKGRQSGGGENDSSETGGGDTKTGSTFDTEELLGQLDKELKNIDQVAATFGDTSEIAANKASALRKAIIELVTNGVDPTNTAMGNLVKQYKKHSQAAEDAKKETYNLSEAESELKEALANIDKQAAVFGDTIDADAEKLKLYQDAITAALVNDEPVENLQKLIAEYTTLKDKIDEATKAKQNNEAATALLGQAQEYLYRMTGKVRPEWEMFAQKLEEMAGKDGVIPEVAEQLQNLAAEIRNAGEEATTVFGMKFTPAMIESFEKTKRAMSEWYNFFHTIISGVQDIYAQMFKNREIKLENWYKTEQEAIENSEKSEEEKKTALETLDEEYEQKKRELMRDRAKAEKNMAIYNVIINTARAAIEALPNLFLSGIVTALGLTQLTLVQNQPLPELAEGGLLTGDTIFRGGEGQYQEAVLPLSDSVFARLAEGILNQLSKMKAPALQAATPSGLVVPEAQVIYETNFNLRVGTLIGNKEGYRQLGREIYPYINAEKKRRGN